MALIQPFKALRPKPEIAQKLASRPYDVLNSTEAKTEANGNPYSFLHITKAEIDLPDGVDIHSQAVYDKAKDNRISDLFSNDSSRFNSFSLRLGDILFDFFRG